MAVTGKEGAQQQSFEITQDGRSATKTYHVFGARGVYEAILNPAVPAYGDLYYDSNIIEEPPIVLNLRVKKKTGVNMGDVDNLHVVTVYYTQVYSADDRPEDPDDGDEIYSYEPTGDTVNIKTSIATVSYGDDVIDYNGKIGCALDGSVQGVDIPDNSEILTVTQWKTTTLLTETYLNNIRAVRNKVCDLKWYGAAIGEVLFEGMKQVGKNEFTTELQFTFKISRNKVEAELPTYYNKDGSTYTISSGKLGWDYLWEQSAEKTNHTTKVTKQYTRGVYVDAIFYTDDFSDLGLANVV